ncbi:hypothetical protein DD593_29490, partial [Enterobacter cloacae complex sp. 742-ADZ3-9B]
NDSDNSAAKARRRDCTGFIETTPYGTGPLWAGTRQDRVNGRRRQCDGFLRAIKNPDASIRVLRAGAQGS